MAIIKGENVIKCNATVSSSLQRAAPVLNLTTLSDLSLSHCLCLGAPLLSIAVTVNFKSTEVILLIIEDYFEIPHKMLCTVYFHCLFLPCDNLFQLYYPMCRAYFLRGHSSDCTSSTAFFCFSERWM